MGSVTTRAAVGSGMGQGQEFGAGQAGLLQASDDGQQVATQRVVLGLQVGDSVLQVA